MRSLRTGILWLGAAWHGTLHRYDPAHPERGLENLGQIDPALATFPTAIAETPDGMIWIGAYPGCSLTRYNPATGEFTRFGRMDDVDKYLYLLAADDGSLYGQIKMTTYRMVHIDPATGRRTQVGPILESPPTNPKRYEFFKGADGKLYLDIPQPIVDLLIAGEQGRLYYKIETVAGDYVTGDPGLPRPPQTPSPSASPITTKRFRICRYVASPCVHRYAPVQALVHCAFSSRNRRGNGRRRQADHAADGTAATRAGCTGAGSDLARRWPRSADADTGQAGNPESLAVDLSPINTHTVPLEIRPLVDAMNDLLNRLGTALAAQQRFIADAAHQLRTPIAALKSQIEVAQRNQGQPEGAATLETLHHAADHATRLVTQLLTMHAPNQVPRASWYVNSSTFRRWFPRSPVNGSRRLSQNR